MTSAAITIAHVYWVGALLFCIGGKQQAFDVVMLEFLLMVSGLVLELWLSFADEASVKVQSWANQPDSPEAKQTPLFSSLASKCQTLLLSRPPPL